MRRFVAYIDHENRFSIEDKLSQVCLNYILQYSLNNSKAYFFVQSQLYLWLGAKRADVQNWCFRSVNIQYYLTNVISCIVLKRIISSFLT